MKWILAIVLLIVVLGVALAIELGRQVWELFNRLTDKGVDIED